MTDSFPSLPRGWLSPLFLITAVACFMQCTRIFFYEGDMYDGLSCVQILPVLTAWYKALTLCPLHSSSGVCKVKSCVRRPSSTSQQMSQHFCSNFLIVKSCLRLKKIPFRQKIIHADVRMGIFVYKKMLELKIFVFDLLIYSIF